MKKKVEEAEKRIDEKKEKNELVNTLSSVYHSRSTQGYWLT